MISISENLQEEIDSNQQIVRPNVKAWMADLRYLENIEINSTSHSYEKQILDKDPKFYLKLDSAYYNSQLGNSTTRVEDFGINSIDFAYGEDTYSYVNFVLNSGNRISTPDSSAFLLTADLDIKMRFSPATWYPDSPVTLVSQWGNSGNKSWSVVFSSSGFKLYFTTNGSSEYVGTSSPISFRGSAKWIRITRSSSTGVISFYYADDQNTVPSSWTLISQFTSFTGAVYNSTADVQIGSSNNVSNYEGNLIYWQISNTIGGSASAIFNADDFSSISATTCSSSTGQTWTLTKGLTSSASIYKKLSELKYNNYTFFDKVKISNTYIEEKEPKRFIDTFDRADQNYIGSATSSDTTDYDMNLYSLQSDMPYWEIYQNTAKNTQINKYDLTDKDNFLKYDTLGKDHYIDFKISYSYGYKIVVVGYKNSNNCIRLSSLNETIITARSSDNYTGSGSYREAVIAYQSGLQLSTSKWYRLQFDANYVYFYDMGTSEPSHSSSGTLLLSGYCPFDSLRSDDNTTVGIGTVYSPDSPSYSSTIRVDYFAAKGSTYLSTGHNFDGKSYIYSSTSLGQNKSSFYSDIINSSNFTSSFLFRPKSGGDAVQSILWIGNQSQQTAFRIAYIQASGKVKVTYKNNLGTTTTLTSNSSLSLNTLYKIAVVKNNTKLSIYINGTSDATTTLAANNAMFDIVTSNAPLISIGADYAGTTLGDASGYHFLRGDLSEISFVSHAFTDIEFDLLYRSFDTTGTSPVDISDSYTTAINVADGTYEETFAYAFTNTLNNNNSYLKTNTSLFPVPHEPTILDNLFWSSRVNSNNLGIFTNPDYIYMTFNAHPCNLLKLSTGFSTGRIKEFDYQITTDQNVIISGSGSFNNESYTYLYLNDVYNIVSIKLTPTSTINPYDFARLYCINPIWEVDLSDYVISVNVDKVRDNFDASLPIGATAANSGSIEFDNTEKLFTTFGNTIYSKYIYPDTIFFIKFDHFIDRTDSYESVPIIYSVYADTWNFSNSSMTATVDFRDYSKFLQEKNVTEFVNQGLTAGRAIKNLMLESGFPNRKISILNSYFEKIIDDNPYIYIPINESSTDIAQKIAESDLNHFHDESGRVRMTANNVSSVSIGSSLLKSDSLTVQDDIQRKVDEYDTEIYNPKYNAYSLLNNSYSELYNLSNSTYWTELSSFSDWSIDFYCYYPSTNTSVSSIYSNIITYNLNTSNAFYAIDVQPTTVSTIKFRFNFYYSSTSHIVQSLEFDRSIPHYISIRKTFGTNDTYELFVDGISQGFVTLPHYTGALSGEKFVVNNSIYISNIAIYKYAISNEIISSHFASGSVSTLPKFKYLYAKDQVYWDAMLSIATADLGMFYFDEYGDFIYEYRNTLNEEFFDRYQISQYNLSDEVNIISGELRTEVQTNKIIVKTNKSSVSAQNSQQLWAAEDGESLAVTTITQNLLPKSQEIILSNTTDPIWLPQGYLKIDDEIIKYEFLYGNSLKVLTRGMFGTKAAWHQSGAKAREVRVYDIEYSNAPAVNVQYPFITANIFESNIDIDYFYAKSYNAKIVISATKNVATDTLVTVQGSNTLSDLPYNFSITGLALSTSSSKEVVSEQISTIEANIRRYGLKELIIDNAFIQNKIYAKLVSDFIITYYTNPVPIINLSTNGIPHLQLGDLVTIEKFDDINIVNEKYWVIENNISYDGGIKQDLVLRKYSAPSTLDMLTITNFASSISSSSTKNTYYFSQYYGQSFSYSHITLLSPPGGYQPQGGDGSSSTIPTSGPDIIQIQKI